MNAPPALPSLAGWEPVAPPTPRAIPGVDAEPLFSSTAPPDTAPAHLDTAPAQPDAPVTLLLETPSLTLAATPSPTEPNAPAMQPSDEPAVPAVDPTAPADDAAAEAVDPMAPAVDPIAPAVAAPATVALQLPTIAAPPPIAPTAALHASAVPGADGLTVEQIQAIQAGQAGARPAAARRGSKRSIGQQVKRVVLASVLVAGLGAGARFGFDEYERRQADSEADAAQGAANVLPAIGEGLPTATAERPTDRFMHVVVKVDDPTDSVTTTIRHDLSTGSMTIDESGSEAGEPFAYMIDVRGDTIVARSDSSSPWVSVGDEPSFAASVDESQQLSAGAILFSDIVPPEMVPYVSVMSETEELLPVVPLDSTVDVSADDVDDVIDSAPATPPTRSAVVRPAAPATVRHYQIALDTAAFAEQHPFLFADAFFAVRLDEPIDLWVDSLGIVRQIGLGGESGASIVFTYYDIAPALPNFQDVVIVATPMAEQQN